MYSYTQTLVHYLTPPEQGEPQLRVKCKCTRTLIQEEIYTCLTCSEYCCHFCTIPEFSFYQCRSCKKIYQNVVKNNKCNTCFSCPYCQNILSITEDPKTKLKILLCLFCYWNSKEINMKDEKIEVLLENLGKLSNKLREPELKIYSLAHTYFKEANLSLETQNKSMNYIVNHKKNSIKSHIEESNQKNKEQLQKLQKNREILIKKTKLDEDSEEYTGNESKYPQALTLLNKKIRRCPNCTKPFTNLYKPSRSTEPKIQLMYKDLKILQCQRLPPLQNSVKVKFLRKASLFGKDCNENEIEEIPVNTEFEVKICVDNKTKGTTTEIVYKFIVESNAIKKK